MAFTNKRRCLHCHTLFIPDQRNSKRQKFCALPECRRASKADSQQRWLDKNPDYFKGADHVQRVQEWRRAHPGYRQGAHKRRGLQDDCPPKSSHKQEVATKEPSPAGGAEPVLQDVLMSQHAVFIGLIAHFTGQVLQDEIATAIHRLAQLGQDVLNGSTLTPGGGHHGLQAPNLSRPHPHHPRTIQLAGSPSGP